MTTTGIIPLPAFPGGVGISKLSVYPWVSADGEHGGSPHMHLACSECYVVISGRGRLETLTASEHRVVPLGPGDVVWFEPGTIHRAINDGDLSVIVVMQNGGLPEAGDAVMTFPPEYLTGPRMYEAHARLVGVTEADREEQARARRDLALEGFQQLAASFDAGDTAPLKAFHRAAVALIHPEVKKWRGIIAGGAAAEAANSDARLDDLESFDLDRLAAARVAHRTSSETSLGMCGTLNAYDMLRKAGSAS